MENPARTLQYLATLEERRAVLRAHFVRVFPAQADFVWEIGCGHGHFLTAYAQNHPERLCIGIDLVSERIERALRKRDRAKLPNLHFIRADARTFLETLPPETNFEATFVLFPYPWPKSRHRKHRILQPDFLVSLAARALPTARLYFRTDFHPYFADVSAALGQGSGWERLQEDWPFEFETVFQSRAKAFHSLVARPLTAARISSPPS